MSQFLCNPESRLPLSASLSYLYTNIQYFIETNLTRFCLPEYDNTDLH